VRAHLARAGLLQDVVLVEQCGGAADAAADDDRQPFGVHGTGQAGVGPGLVRGDQGHGLAAVQPA